VHIHLVRIGRLENVRTVAEVVSRPVGNKEIFVGLDRGIILQNTVLGDTDAIEPGAKGAETPGHDCTFESTDDGGGMLDLPLIYPQLKAGP